MLIIGKFIFILFMLVSISIIGIIKPVLFLSLVVFLLPLKAVYARGIFLHLPKFLMLVPLLGLLFKLMVKKSKVKVSGLEWPIILVIAFNLLHFPDSFRPTVEIMTIWYFLGLYGFTWSIFNLVDSPKNLKVLVFSFFVSAAIPSFAAYYQWFTKGPFLGVYPMYFQGIPRATGTFLSITGLGDFLSAYLVFSLGVVITSPIAITKKKFYDILLIILFSLPMLFSYNKSGILAAIVGLTILYFNTLKKHQQNFKKILSFLLILLLILGVIIYILQTPSWRQRIFGVEGHKPPSYQYRINDLKMIGKVLVMSPLIGVGLGNYRYLVISSPERRLALQPHNLVLVFAAFGGFTGIFILILMIGIVIKKYGKFASLCQDKSSFQFSVMESAGISLIGYSANYLTHGALGSDVHWILLGILFAGGYLCVQSKR